MKKIFRMKVHTFSWEFGSEVQVLQSPYKHHLISLSGLERRQVPYYQSFINQKKVLSTYRAFLKDTFTSFGLSISPSFGSFDESCLFSSKEWVKIPKDNSLRVSSLEAWVLIDILSRSWKNFLKPVIIQLHRKHIQFLDAREKRRVPVWSTSRISSD